jgi:hypothetical protein
MDEYELERAWTALDPRPDQVRRMRVRVSDWIDAHDTPLAAEWLGLIRVSPFTSLFLAAVSVLSIFVGTPILWLARAMM